MPLTKYFFNYSLKRLRFFDIDHDINSQKYDTPQSI